VLRRARVRPAEDEAPVGAVGRRGPDLLAVDDPRVAAPLGARLHVGEVRPRVGLRVPLAPERAPLAYRGEEAFLLRCGPEGDQRRAEQLLADVAEPPGRPRARVLLVEDDLLGERRVAPAVLFRPAQARPAGYGELALPGAAEIRREVLVPGTPAAAERRESADEVRLEPRASLAAEPLVAWRPSKFH
jgi:hypothetical protein